MQQYVFSLSAPAHSIKYRWAHLSSSVFLASPVKRSVDVSPVHEDTNKYSHHHQRVCVCFCFGGVVPLFRSLSPPPPLFPLLLSLPCSLTLFLSLFPPFSLSLTLF